MGACIYEALLALAEQQRPPLQERDSLSDKRRTHGFFDICAVEVDRDTGITVDEITGKAQRVCLNGTLQRKQIGVEAGIGGVRGEVRRMPQITISVAA